SFILCLLPPDPTPTAVPSTTLFRSRATRRVAARHHVQHRQSRARHARVCARARYLRAGLRARGADRAIGDPARSARGHGTLPPRSEENTSELESPYDRVCRLLDEKK